MIGILFIIFLGVLLFLIYEWKKALIIFSTMAVSLVGFVLLMPQFSEKNFNYSYIFILILSFVIIGLLAYVFFGVRGSNNIDSLKKIDKDYSLINETQSEIQPTKSSNQSLNFNISNFLKKHPILWVLLLLHIGSLYEDVPLGFAFAFYVFMDFVVYFSLYYLFRFLKKKIKKTN